VTRLTDALFGLELDLAKYPGDDENDALNRRIILRKALNEHGQERYDEGYLDGRRDVMDARAEAQRRADAARQAGDPE
jgi:hypothetical protein